MFSSAGKAQLHYTLFCNSIFICFTCFFFKFYKQIHALSSAPLTYVYLLQQNKHTLTLHTHDVLTTQHNARRIPADKDEEICSGNQIDEAQVQKNVTRRVIRKMDRDRCSPAHLICHSWKQLLFSYIRRFFSASGDFEQMTHTRHHSYTKQFTTLIHVLYFLKYCIAHCTYHWYKRCGALEGKGKLHVCCERRSHSPPRPL